MNLDNAESMIFKYLKSSNHIKVINYDSNFDSVNYAFI